MMIAISKDICVGDFCQALPQEVPTQLGIIDEIQSIANSLFFSLIEAARSHTSLISSSVGGLFLANGGIHLAKPQASGCWVLTNFIASGVFAGIAGIAENDQSYQSALLYSVFWGSALLMAVNRIKTLENQHIK